jgi:hypothetical protein
VVNNFFHRANSLGCLRKGEFDLLWTYIKRELGISKRLLLDLEKEKLLNIEKVYSHVADLKENTIGVLVEKLIHDVLVECTALHKKKICPYHTALIHMLQPSTIISFNYDLICDRVLASMWPEWEKDAGLPFDFRFDGKRFVETGNRWSHPWSHHQNEDLELLTEFLARAAVPVPQVMEDKNYPIYLKLHGSLNWYYDITHREQRRATRAWKEVLSLYFVPLEFAFTTKRIYQKRGDRDYLTSTIMTSAPGTTFYHGTAELKLAIVPPVYQKEFLPFFKLNWKMAEKALSEAERIVFVGYSLPDIDLRAERLFRKSYLACRNRSNILVDVVDPNRAVVKRMKSIYRESKVRGRDGLQAFATTLGI